MTDPSQPHARPRRRRPPRRGRIRTGRLVALVALAAVVFALGFAIGEAVNDNPAPGRNRTFVRTFAPLPPAPVPETVTVTESTP